MLPPPLPQTLAGLAAYRFSWLLWALEMTPDHKERAHEQACQSSLQVDVVKGLMFEGGAALGDMYINAQPISSVGKLDTFLKYVFGTMYLCWGEWADTLFVAFGLIFMVS